MKKYGILSSLLLPTLLACGGQKFNIPSQSASFQQTPTYNNQVDILFMVDDSSAMQPYRAQMGAQAQAMITQLNAMGMSYHLAVTTTSVGAGYLGGTLVGNTYLTNGSPSVAASLSNLLNYTMNNSDLEQGFTSIEYALSPSNLSLSGGGFLRSGALLAIIMMSSDNDYSGFSSASMVTFMNNLKPPFPNGAPSWVANYIGSLSLNSGCQQFVNVGTAYIQLAQANSGVTTSICNTNWAVTMTNVQVMISQLMTNYYLKSQPNPSTIVVNVNGVVVPNNATNGWTLQTSGSGNATQYYIHFNGTAIPSLYSTVTVSFTPATAS